MFGGVSNIQREPTSPRSEFLIAIAGPLMSLFLGIVMTLLAGVSASPMDTMTGAAGIIASLNPLSLMLLWLGASNILLALFNVIPGFPLDGGRVLRSILWGITGSLRKATRWASGVGQVIAWLFIAAGIMMAFGTYIPFFGTGLINGLWLAFIGWFLNSAAQQSYQQVVVQDLLHGVTVSRLMRANPPTVPSTMPVSVLVRDYVMQSDDYAFPVVDDGRLRGIVTLADLRSVPRLFWDRKTVGDIMTPAEKLVVAMPEDNADEAWNRLMNRDVQQLPVVRGGQFAGLFRRRDITKWLHLQSDMHSTAA
jgi:Zn-dependent protease